MPSSAAFAQETTGGSTYTPLPVISSVKCVSMCSGKTRVQAGGTLRVAGKRLRSVRTVVFNGSSSTTSDDVKARVRPSATRAFRVKVPYSAASGTLSVLKSATVGSEPSDRIAVLPPPPPEQSAELTPSTGPRDPGAPALETGISSGRVYVAGTAVRFSYRVNSDEPVPVTVELVRAENEAIIRTWNPGAVEPNTVHTIRWTGKTASGAAKAGRYVFRVTAQSSDGALARSSSTTDATRDAFDLFSHIFPIRGRHDYGSAGSRFGSGRSGHSHQGQDVFAKCGTKLVAARAGTVKFNQYHSAAGYYVVVDGYKSQFDYVYMHLQERSPFRTGDKLRTGQMLGRVGDTGNAQGCHLHYEMWSAPGWYDGGNPFDPYRFLKAWDAWS
jgi:murein DD-endopeptidase MepM/ murein hydrolase activator NlpD